jgi:hypothetical protein
MHQKVNLKVEKWSQNHIQMGKMQFSATFVFRPKSENELKNVKNDLEKMCPKMTRN